MSTRILRFLFLACITAFFAASAAFAETPPEEEKEDIGAFAKSLIGKAYSGDLELEGWTDLGGGLVAPPVYVHHYQREGGTSLVLTSKLSGKTHEVVDALVISKPWKGYAISIACTQGKDFTLRFIGDARGLDQQEWWTEVRRAWEIEIPPEPDPEEDAEAGDIPAAAPAEDAEDAPVIGTISKASTRGVKCTNPNW